MGNILQRLLVFFGFKRTDTMNEEGFTNIATVENNTSAINCNVVPKLTQTQSEGKQYSWDKRRAAGPVDRSLWNIKDVVDSSALRLPSSVGGNDLEIQNCKNSRIFILDHCSQIIIENCESCKFIMASVRGNVFFRNCAKCHVVVATSQFRTRDCTNCDFYLYCQTVPIIESSEDFRFHCFQMTYQGLQQHLSSAGLASFNNNWTTIHDFTPEPGKRNFSFVTPPYQDLSAIFPTSDLGPEVEKLDIDFSPEKSIIPSTFGNSLITEMKEALIVVAPGITQLSTALTINALLSKPEPGLKIKHTGLYKISIEDATRIFCEDFGALSPDCFDKGNILWLVIADATNNSGNIVDEIKNLLESCKELLKKLPLHEIFLSSVVIEEMVRYAASRISG